MGKIFNKADLTEKRRVLRKSMPEPEHRLWLYLRSRQLKGYKFRRQVSIGGYIVDFFCPELRLAIEIDGDTHCVGNACLYDQCRQMFIESFNVNFIRFTNLEIIESLEGVVEKIKEALPDK